MKMISIKYDKKEHMILFELFQWYIFSITFGVPGDWFFGETVEDSKTNTILGFITNEYGSRTKSVGFVFFIVMFAFSWGLGDYYGR